MQCFFQWKRMELRSQTFSSQTLFISVVYIHVQCGCDKEFLNLKMSS